MSEPGRAANAPLPAAPGASPAPPPGLGRNFWLLWAGQMVVQVGAGMTEFALGIWAARHTGSVSQYTLVVLFAVLPGLLATPWLGAWVDRAERRRLALWAEAGAGLAVLVLWLSLRWGGLQLWEVYAVAAGLSVFSALQRLVYATLVPSLVPPGQLLRASGLMQMAGGLAPLVAPALAGLALAALQLSGVLAAHLLAVTLCLGTLMLLRPPPAVQAPAPVGAPARTVWRDLAVAWAWLKARRPLLLLLGYTTCEVFTVTGVMLLLTPMVLAGHSEQVLGSLVLTAGVGLLLGSAVAGSLRTPRRLVRAILLVDLVLGLGVLAVGAAPTLPLLFAAVLVLNACFSLVSSAHQVIWQTQVPPALLGRVLALVQMLVTGAAPVAAVAGGLMADGLFEPLMQPGGAGAALLGPCLGSGPGRGIALMFVVAGGLVTALAAGALLIPRLRDLETPVDTVEAPPADSTAAPTPASTPASTAASHPAATR